MAKTPNAAAVALGSLGGKARAASLSAAQRSAIAKRAGQAPKKARTPRATCDVCPHVDYLTLSVVQSKHQCASCGETFVDEVREKRYFGRTPR